jgi:hypothetical protein
MPLPPIAELTYNKQKLGYFGELGNGAYARIRFLQSAVTKDELDNITLIENIPGSERWNIQDLFQRDVDMVRVEQSILPYLADPTKVKFFNPLTLVLLPISPITGAVDADVQYVEPESFDKEGHSYSRYERKGLFCYDVHKEVPAYSELRWNDKKVKLVAIDGQHRLSALKFWKDVPGPKALDAWQIPVVILGVFREDSEPTHAPAKLLEIVRKTFVYINTRAEEVNEARRILLDDEELQAVCTQEFVQASHANDCLPDDAMDTRKLPLLFFDWRGQVRWRKDDAGAEVVAPGSVIKIIELHDWLSEYVLGDAPDTVLELDDLDPPLSDAYRDRSALTSEDTKRVRERFMSVLYPGVSQLLEGFEPYRKYVEKIRAFEKAKRQESEGAGYAFQKLRFGSHPVLLGQMKELADNAFETIVSQLARMRQDCFDELIERDIGMRAVMCAFGTLKGSRDAFAKKTLGWKEHAAWFVPRINAVYKAGWLKEYSELKNEQSKMLTHICFDPSGGIVNYKIVDVPRALGALLALLVVHHNLDEFTAEHRAELWDAYSDGLGTTLRKGFRKEQRAKLRDTFEGTQPEFIAEVNQKADADVKARLKLIRTKTLGLVD